MNFAMIYVKTARGVAEMKSRSDALSAQARRVLIMIDGKRSETDLAPVVRGGALDSVLAELRGLGMIEECGIAELPADAAATEADQVTVALEPALRALDLGLPVTERRAMPPPPTLRVAVGPTSAAGSAPPSAPAAASDRPAPVLHPVPQPIPLSAARSPQSPPAPPAPAPRPAAAPAARRFGEPEPGSLEDTKRAAVRALYERLGPYGEEPAARIQECKTMDALQGELANACKRISTFRGEAASREYLAALGMA